MAKSLVTCACCCNQFLKENGALNRAVALGQPVYCDKVCAGKGRRGGLSDTEKKERKRLYDIDLQES